jgi:hypothetical protein
MQLLIVHSDPELGDQLLRMVGEYTTHECDVVGSDVAAVDWGRRHSECSLLLAQLEGNGVDGLSLGSSLSEIFPALQTLFFPSYSATDRRLEIARTKVFPEPIEGDALLTAIEHAEKAVTADADLFHVVDVIQMCCLGQRSGALQIVKEKKSGLVFLRNGRLLHVETTAARGMDALHELVDWDYIEFAYDHTIRPPVETITAPWDEALIEAVTLKKDDKLGGRRKRA